MHSAMAASASTYGSSPFLPHARGGGQTSFRGVGHALGGGGGVSTQSQPAPDSVGLTKAMSKVMLQDSYSRHGAGMSNGAGLAAMDASQPQGGGGSGSCRPASNTRCPAAWPWTSLKARARSCHCGALSPRV